MELHGSVQFVRLVHCCWRAFTGISVQL